MADHAGAEDKTPLFNEQTYDFLSDVVKLGLPGAGTLYFTLAQVWGLPAAEQVVSSIAALALFLGVLLYISKKRWEASDAKYDGALVIDTTDPNHRGIQALEANEIPLEDLVGKKSVLLKLKEDDGFSLPDEEDDLTSR
jgi:hypothetical protein